MTECRTTHSRKLTRLRELDELAPGTLVLATSSPAPRYFLRVAGGWHAADSRGDTTLQRVLAADLDGWPAVLPHRDIRRPVYVVAKPDELDPHPALSAGELAALTALGISVVPGFAA